ncbi:LysR substrate-binding domain-containing protein [Roseateles sp. P5_E7]
MIEALDTFLAVAAHGSFSEVARRQDVAVSSVTRKIDALEVELGAKLFHRSPRRLALTDAGEQFLPRARNILGELAGAKEALQAGDGDPRGLLTVTAPTVFGRQHVVSALASFLRRYPDIEVDLHLIDQVIDLSEQRMDVAIRIGLLPDSDLRATTLAPVRLVTCASPAYLARAGHPTSPLDLMEHACITVATPPAPGFVWRYAGINRNQPLPVRGPLRTDDKDGMLQAALQGLGVIHIATWVVCNQLRSGELIALFPEEAAAAASPGMPAIHAVRLPGRSHATKARLFIDHLRAEIGETPWWDRLLQPEAGALMRTTKNPLRVDS